MQILRFSRQSSKTHVLLELILFLVKVLPRELHVYTYIYIYIYIFRERGERIENAKFRRICYIYELKQSFLLSLYRLGNIFKKIHIKNFKTYILSELI